MIIVFEGFDKVGKGTQSRLLAERLKKSNEVHIRHTSLIFNKDITNSKMCSEAKFFAYFAATKQAFEDARNLDGPGKVIILDRYIYTHVAYTLAAENNKIETNKLAILLTALNMYQSADCTFYLERELAIEDNPFAQRVCKFYDKILPKQTVKVQVEEGKVSETFEHIWDIFENIVKRNEYAVII